MTKVWLKAAAIRAVRSFAQGALASIGTGAVLTEVNWLATLCTGALAAVVSVLMSLTGLPEAKPDIMSGAGENFDLNGADRPRKCVSSITEIMELMGLDPAGGTDTPQEEEPEDSASAGDRPGVAPGYSEPDPNTSADTDSSGGITAVKATDAEEEPDGGEAL